MAEIKVAQKKVYHLALEKEEFDLVYDALTDYVPCGDEVRRHESLIKVIEQERRKP